VLDNYWHIACRSRELGRKPVARRLFNRKLVLFRDQDGNAVALEDRCKHRNAPLSGGRVCKGAIRCPYHGWLYDADGRIVDIPARPADAQDAVSGMIQKFTCAEQQEYVWVCIGENPATPLPDTFPNLGASGWTSFRMKTRFRANVESCLENFLDCPHATYVHRGWFRSPTRKTVKVIVRTLEDGAEAEYFAEPREKSVVWSLLSPGRHEMRHTDRYIAPSTTRVDYSFSNGMHYTITSCCTPVSDTETDVYTVINFRIKWLGRLVRLYFQPLSKWIIKQDVVILDTVSENIRAHDGANFDVLESDLLFEAIKQWRQAIVNSQQPPAPGMERHVELCL